MYKNVHIYMYKTCTRMYKQCTNIYKNVQQKYQSNIVKALAVGPDVKQAKKGDDIMVNPVQTGTIIEIEKKSYIMIPEHFCLGVFKWTKKSLKDYFYYMELKIKWIHSN